MFRACLRAVAAFSPLSETPMMARPRNFDLSVFAALAVVMLITRSHSLSQYVHVPDTSLASFFVPVSISVRAWRCPRCLRWALPLMWW
jgi:hypothetical protein